MFFTGMIEACSMWKILSACIGSVIFFLVRMIMLLFFCPFTFDNDNAIDFDLQCGILLGRICI